MRLFQRERAQGKTHNLVKWMLAEPGRRGVIVPNSAQRDFFLGEMYSVMAEREMAQKDPAFNATHWPSLVRVPSRSQGLRGTDIEWAIDNLDHLLFDILGTRVTVSTTTEPFENVAEL